VNEQDKSNPPRNYGIDLLRCLMMYGIVVHHSCCHTRFSTLLWPDLVFLITVPCVDGFVAISGLYGIRFHLKKFVALIGSILYTSLGLSFAAFLFWITGTVNQLMISAGVGWFGQCYLALFSIAPLVCMPERIAQQRFGMVAFVGVLGLVICGNWYVTAMGIGGIPGCGTHTFGCLLFVYCAMRVASTWLGVRPVSTWILITIIGLLYAIYIAAILPSMPMVDQNLASKVCEWGGYNAPVVIVIAISLVFLFSKIRVPEWGERILHIVTPSLLPVYILHDAHCFGREMLIVRPLNFINDTFAPGCGGAVLVIFFWSILVFVLCLVTILSFAVYH